MTVRLKILDRYLCREFLTVLAGVVSACAVVLLIAKVFEEFDTILQGPATTWDAVKYFAYALPQRLLEVVPLAAVLAVIFSIGALARNREMLAVTASGRSLVRSSAPVLAAAVVLSAACLVMNETVVPYCEKQVQFYEKGLFKGRGEFYLNRRTGIFVKGVGHTFFSMSWFDAAQNRMENVLMFEETQDPKFWRYSVLADTAKLVKKNVAPNEDLWEFKNATEVRYTSQGLPSVTTHAEPIRKGLEADLEAYLANRKDPEEMNLMELGRYIRTLEMRGEDVSKYLTDWYRKLAFPFSTAILAIMAFALAARAHTGSLPMAFGFGVFLTMLFYALSAMGQTLGHKAVISPLVGSVGPGIVFLAAGIYMIRRSGFAT
jgi:lipopolysaccharide export system permease protein